MIIIFMTDFGLFRRGKGNFGLQDIQRFDAIDRKLGCEWLDFFWHHRLWHVLDFQVCIHTILAAIEPCNNVFEICNVIYGTLQNGHLMEMFLISTRGDELS